MLTKVAPGDPRQDREVISYALARWDRTARLCAIRLTEAWPTVIPFIWVILRH